MTPEQELIINEVTTDVSENALVQIVAGSGSGKTYVLRELAKALPYCSGMYLAYSKPIADEAKTKFPSRIDCRTTHSLAYKHVVIPYNLTVGKTQAYEVMSQINVTYSEAVTIMILLEEFYTSRFISVREFAKHKEVKAKLANKAHSLLESIIAGNGKCSFGFMLKLFHIMLHSNKIKLKPMDLLFLDEAGDLNEVTLEVFKLLPAYKKVMVGDPDQNIYTFNKTINCFDVMQGVGKLYYLTKSFRVHQTIAKQVQKYCRDTFNPHKVFEGVEYPDTVEVETEAFIFRNNSSIIAKMIMLNTLDQGYTLIKSVKSMFSVVNMLMGIGTTAVKGEDYKYLNKDVEDYNHSEKLQERFTTPLAYIIDLHGVADSNLKTSYNLILKYKGKGLQEARKIAQKYEDSLETYPITLCTAHSSKGLEFDRVIIGDDLNKQIRKIYLKGSNKWTEEDISELRLYYVAITRAKLELNNATAIERYA